MFRHITYSAAAATALLMLTPGLYAGVTALLLVSAVAAVTIYIIRRYCTDSDFLITIFIGALCVRMLFGLVLEIFDLREFAAPDTLGYDLWANRVVDVWLGLSPETFEIRRYLSLIGSGWGMNYVVALLYLITDRSMFATQSFFGAIGAAIIPALYFCADALIHNRRVSRSTAVVAAFLPGSIIWTSQMLKDGIIVFFLVLSLTLVIKLRDRFSWIKVSLLVGSIFGVLAFRFYVFYFVAFATVAGLFIGVSDSLRSVVQRVVIITLVAGSLAYLGVGGIAQGDIERYGSLDRVQASRSNLAGSAASGYGTEQNVSTIGGVLSVLPIGFAYLMFAPFPWEAANLRQAITLPDSLFWWALFPIAMYGLWFTLRNRLREVLPIVVFIATMTFAYSVFQGNVGTAYRQRLQIQIFLFIFFGIGLTVIRERQEDKKALALARIRSSPGALQGH